MNLSFEISDQNCVHMSRRLMHAACLTDFIPLYLITGTILGEEYK